MPNYPCSCPTDYFDNVTGRCSMCGWSRREREAVDDFNYWARTLARTPQRIEAPMDWNSMGEQSQDNRAAANHTSRIASGYFTEEMLVHAEDGTLLGKLITNTSVSATRAYFAVPALSVTFGNMEIVREELVKRMSGGFQV
jgi:hypothetical protein